MRCAIARLAAAFPLLAALALISGCASLPPLGDRPATSAVEPDVTGQLGRSVAGLTRQHPGKTGVVAIGDGRVAFATRVLLARAASRSIDIQTYIWRGDATGTFLFEELVRAAGRGVRVRLLLDDGGTSGLDPTLAMLAAQPGIEVRLYNPFVSRGSRALGFLGDFERLNHRMHNKSVTVDSQVVLVGGRNIADEYFEAGQEEGLIDLDVIAVGDVVSAVAAEFDLYWNSPSAYPVSLILAGVVAESRDALAQRARDVIAKPTSIAYAEAIARTVQVQRLLDGSAELEWTSARLIYDDPAKTLSPGTETDLQMLPKLIAAFGQPVSSLDLISPYFVPGDTGTETLAGMAQRGVKVRVLTNSLAATDVMAVHTGYAKRREPLLKAGVQLFELRPEASPIKKHAVEVGGSSKASLHAKTYAVDRRAIFVGSFNLDPRSSKLNTEMGMVIDSPTLARRLAAVLDKAYPDLAYRVTLDADGDLQWADGTGVTYSVDPETGWFTRMMVRIGGWLPVEPLL